MKRRLIQLALGLAVSVGLVALLLLRSDTGAVARAISVADARLVVAAIAVYVFAMCVRAVVWGRLLSSSTNSLSTTTLFKAMVVGFAISFLMPLRVGEIVRAYLLKRWSNVEYGTTLASIVAERVLDGLAVGTIMLVAALVAAAPVYMVGFSLSVIAGFAVLMGLLILASMRGASVVSLSTALAAALPARLGNLIARLGRGFAFGLEPLRSVRALPQLLGLSVAGWLCQFLVFYLIMLALPVPASFPAALLSGGFANFATLLPSAPGFVGTFDAAIMKVVMDVQGVALESAAAYAVLVHAVVVIPIVLMGLLISWRANLSIGYVMRRSIGGRPAAAPATAIAAPAVNTTVVPF
jgi:uncharacterized protein (TIRG00374 family)